MTWKTVNNSDPGDATHHGGDSTDKISNLFNGVLDVDPVDLNTIVKFRTQKFRWRDSDNSNDYIVATGDISTDATLTIPSISGNDTFVFRDLAQILTNKTIDADNNTITDLVDANIKSGAGIAKSKISTTGAWAVSELPTATVYTDTANTFGAGLKQSVQHNSTTSGIRIVPATGDPSNPQDGDIWYNSTTSKFRKRQNGSTSDLDTQSGTIALDDLSDVVITSPSDGQALKYNASLSRWENGTVTGGSSEVTASQWKRMHFMHAMVKKEGTNYKAEDWEGNELYSGTDGFTAIQTAIDDLPTGPDGGSTKAGIVGIWPPSDGSDIQGSATVSRTNTGAGSDLTVDVCITIPTNSPVALIAPAWKSVKLTYTGALTSFRMLQTNHTVMEIALSSNNVQEKSVLHLHNIIFNVQKSGFSNTAVCIEKTKQYDISCVSVRNDADPNPPNSSSVGMDLRGHNNERSNVRQLSINRFAKNLRISTDHTIIDNYYAGEYSVAGVELYGVPYLVNIRKIMGFRGGGNLILNSTTDQSTRIGQARVSSIDEIFDEGDVVEGGAGMNAYPAKAAIVNNVNATELIIGKIQQRHLYTSNHVNYYDGHVEFIKVTDSFYPDGLGEDGFGRKYKGGVNFIGNKRNISGLPMTWDNTNSRFEPIGEVVGTYGTQITYANGTHGPYENYTVSSGNNGGTRYDTKLDRRYPHYVIQRFAVPETDSKRFFVGQTDQTISGQVGSSIAPNSANYIGVAYDAAVDGNIHIVNNNGGASPNNINTGIALTTAPLQVLIQMSAKGGRGGMFLQIWSGDADGATGVTGKLLYQFPNDFDASGLAIGTSTGLSIMYAYRPSAASKSFRSFGVALHGL